MAKASLSCTGHFLSAGCNTRLMHAINLSTPCCCWVKQPDIALSLASVLNVNLSLALGIPNTGVDYNTSLSLRNAATVPSGTWSRVQVAGQPFFVKAVSGAIMSANFLMLMPN